ncbi:methyl-accepting chemotaxis protein, partial [Vibrio tubiashii ATCC 19109]
MDMLALSQKQKVMLFLVVLALGFVALAGFTSSRLTQMSDQYHLSSDISTGSMSIYQTQSKILTLSSNLDNLSGSQVSTATQEISAIVAAVNKDAEFLSKLELTQQADKLTRNVNDFESA